MELETKTLEVLGGYSSLDFESLKDLCLADEYSYAKEEALKETLADLVDRGVVKSGGKFGPFWLATAGRRSPGGEPLPQAASASNGDPGRRSIPPGRRRAR